jgi:3-oxosteroid 1-dehydrogenase
MTDWNHTTDILVIGSGGGGMTAAITSKDQGSDVLIIEKGDLYGGSTSLSGGAIWVPNNIHMKKAGMPDSTDEALRYLKTITESKIADDRLQTYISKSAEMTDYLNENTYVRFKAVPGYADYYPNVSGSKPNGGRTIEPVPFYAHRLGKLLQHLQQIPPQTLVFGKIFLGAYQFHQMFDTSLLGRLKCLKVLSTYYLNPKRVFHKNDPHLTLGTALIARLRLSLQDRNIPLWLNTSSKKLITENGRVIGIEAKKNDQTIHIRAKKGVILAAGGFEQNKKMREKYQQQPISDAWTAGNKDNTGDAIQMGMEIGGDIDFMDDSWWMSTTPVPDAEYPYMILVERTLPGSIIVNNDGKRFTNEAGPYIDVVKDQYASHNRGTKSVPAYLIVDQKYRKNFPIGPIMPFASHKEFVENGFLKVANTIKELAEKCGIDPDGLQKEIETFNGYATAGKDPEFNRGENSTDRYYSDQSVKPNSCLAPLKKPPFYAIELYPGDLGTKGGLKTDSQARVLREDDSPIEGLYATGNCSASVMGNTYPGAGGTIGPAMTFGYIAALHASK